MVRNKPGREKDEPLAEVKALHDFLAAQREALRELVSRELSSLSPKEQASILTKFSHETGGDYYVRLARESIPQTLITPSLLAKGKGPAEKEAQDARLPSTLIGAEDTDDELARKLALVAMRKEVEEASDEADEAVAETQHSRRFLGRIW